jgi:hypothetical protein
MVMDSTKKLLSKDEIENAVVKMLMESGQLADLGNASLEAIENETIDSIDAITREVISKLLGKQADQTEPPKCCPKCGGELCEKLSQGRSMESRRGRVHFKCNVFHCEACRLDFFPSVQNTRL